MVIKHLTMQQAVELLAYEYPPGDAFMMIDMCGMGTSNPKWVWQDGKLIPYMPAAARAVGYEHKVISHTIHDNYYTRQDWVVHARDVAGKRIP